MPLKTTLLEDFMESPLPGYKQLCDELWTLLSTFPPPFIYIQDLETTQTTFSVVHKILRRLSGASPHTTSCKIHFARVDAISCFTPRLLYETIIHSLVGWEPSWEDGCAIWDADNDIRWNENLNTFLHGLRTAHESLCSQAGINMTGGVKGKEKSREGGYENVRFVIVIERAERLKEDHPELLVPLTRLAELARLDLSIIFISQVGWEDVRPPLGASPDPYYVDVSSLSKENIAKILISKFTTYSTGSHDILTNPYHPNLSSLYIHFVTMLCDVCYPFSHDPQELQYIAAARWVGFVKPLIDDYKQRLAKQNDGEDSEDMDTNETEFIAPSEDLRIRLLRYFNASFTTAMEALLPRQTNAADWALVNEPPDNLLSMSRAEGGYRQQPMVHSPLATHNGIHSLPRMSKFIMIASFLASMNPAKSDLRMFGRGIDEKKRRRRVMKTERKTKSSAPAKIAQKLLGPAPFPVDRMIAILGALLEENDVESRLSAPEFRIPGEYTDMEITRVGVYCTITELTSMGLLHRTTPPDRLDGPPMFKCAISYDDVLGLAKELDVSLNDLFWDLI